MELNFSRMRMRVELFCSQLAAAHIFLGQSPGVVSIQAKMALTGLISKLTV
jgi:hypothetical protein